MNPRIFLFGALCMTAIGVVIAQEPAQQPPQPASQSEVSLVITSEPGSPVHYAVPDFIPLTTDSETVAAARLMGEVLWNDLAFEREFDMIPRDIYRTIPQQQSAVDVPFDRWRELGADGVVVGTVRRAGNDFTVEMRLFDVKSRTLALGRVYERVSLRNPRAAAHHISDDIHMEQRQLRGVARTKLTFVSDRDNERIVDTVEKRTGKEVYVVDYDGANQSRVTANRRLNINPSWAPDGRTVAYVSYTRIVPQIIASNVYLGTRDVLTDDKTSSHLPVYSPDGSRICFMSDRDGQMELYVMNRDGSNFRRLTNHPAADSTPTWSPIGTQIAFTSDRSGTPQIYVMDADGLNVRRITSESWADRPTWSASPYNEIAYAGRTGPGFDIKIYDVATRETRVLTDGSGSNESPAFAPNGRHIAFTSTRAGKVQIFTIDRDGKNLRRITSVGNNWTPHWSR
jgi:TolB protein